MKKAFFMGLLLVIVLVAGLSMVSAAPAATDYLVGDRFLAPNTENFWGPYGPSFSLRGGAIVFDSNGDGWLTINFKDDELATDAYKYAIVVLKADNPTDAQGVTMTFGNVKKTFNDWGITLSDTYTTYYLDLAAQGLTRWGDGKKYEPDFALNKVPDKMVKVFVDKIKLTNKAPEPAASPSPSK